MLLAITTGEPAGIGPDIVIRAHTHLHDCVVIGDRNLLAERARQFSVDIEWCSPDDQNTTSAKNTRIRVLHIPLAKRSMAGRIDPDNARYVLNCIDEAVDGCLSGKFAGMITAPVHKAVINDAGILFSGHTEYIAERTQAHPVMMLAVNEKRVALATTHLPLAQVSASITKESLLRVVRIIDHDLRRHLGIRNPRIAVCGLNPHAGEQGHLGREEIDVIIPALEQLRRENIHVQGPLPADTLFTGNCFEKMDVALAMYHDQGLPVIKHIGFGKVVNITLGLPIIRTSVDHGTALELAGTGTASCESLLAALEYARKLAQNTGQETDIL